VSRPGTGGGDGDGDADDGRPDGGVATGADRGRVGGATTGTGPRPAGYRHLARAVLTREYLVFVRYPADAVGAVVVSLFFFGLLFYGGRMVAGRALTDSIEGIVVGYFLWTLAVGAYSGVANDIQAEVQWGTLERHLLTPFGFAPVVLLKGVAKVVRSFVVSGVILAAMLLATGTALELNVLTVVVVAALSITSVLGLGMAAGGVALLYKRVGSWLNLLQFGFVLLVSAPAFDLPWARFLPLAQGSALLQRAMLRGTRLWEFGVADLAVLVGVAAAYLAVGYVVFRLATRRARRLGVLGDY
jgi:ABC-2 type transport system permease protein